VKSIRQKQSFADIAPMFQRRQQLSLQADTALAFAQSLEQLLADDRRSFMETIEDFKTWALPADVSAALHDLRVALKGPPKEELSLAFLFVLGDVMPAFGQHARRALREVRSRMRKVRPELEAALRAMLGRVKVAQWVGAGVGQAAPAKAR
jgi:hypothetical protein